MTSSTISKEFRPLSYDRVRKNVLEMIRVHRLAPGDKLPSERELSKTFGLNHRTVRRGLAILEEEKVIVRRVGAGTFVHQLPEGGQPKTWAERTKLMVGIICPARLDNFAVEYLNHLQALSLKREISLVLRATENFESPACDLAGEMVEQGCQALIVPWLPQPEPVGNLVKLVHSVDVPVVLDRPYPGLEANCSETIDHFGQCEFGIIDMIGRYFLKLDFHRIAFFGPDSQNIEGLGHRVLAYSRFTSGRGLDSFIGLAGTGTEQVDRVVTRWSKFAGDFAVICFDDDHAIRLMTALHKQGLKIPDDIAVFGYNNIPLCENTDPPLSTVQFDYETSARIVLDHLLRMLGRPVPVQEIHGTKPLVIRESCGGRRRRGNDIQNILTEIQS